MTTKIPVELSSTPSIVDGGNATAITIDSSENVGIGTTSPATILHAKASGDAELRLEAGTNQDARVRFGDATDNDLGYIGFNRNAGYMNFSINNTQGEHMRIDSAGRLLVGTTSINGAMGNFVASNGVTGLNIFQSSGSGSHTLVAFNVSGGGVSVGTITTNSSTTAYNTTSDARLKNILGEAKGLEIINKLNPVNFEWKESKEIQDGLIAQEVLKIVPNAVTGSEEDYYQMDYSKLVTPLIKAIQEQQEQIDALQSEINLLKGE
jgi:hypothetical protein